MKKLIFRAGLLVLLLASILYVAGLAYVKTNTYQNIEINAEITKFHTIPDKIDVAFFGASHSQKAFCMAPEGSTFFNFALSSQTPQYDLALLQQYQDCIRPGALVVLTVSYISPYWTDTDEQFQSKQERYYHFLDARNIVDVDLTKYCAERFFPVLARDANEVAVAFLSKVPLDTSPLVKDQNQEYTDRDPEAERTRIVRDHLSSISPVFPEYNPVMWDAFHQMIQLCHEHDWTPVLVTPPFTDDYNQVFDDAFCGGFYDNFYDWMDELSRQTGAPYLDYSHAEAFRGRPDLFRDIDHLNLTGAELFDEQFFQDLHEQDIWS